jgi:RNA-directed DNA polymerase
MSGSARKSLSLNECWLFAVASKKDLARRLSTEGFEVSVRDLDNLSRDDGNFRIFDIVQNGKARTVQEPRPMLQRLHTRVHRLLSRVEAPNYLHSTTRKRSYLTNARSHNPNHPTIKIDIKKFFPSVPRVAIYNFFHSEMRCRSDVAGLLSDILTYNSGLATGSSASPILSYYAFKEMFDEVYNLANQYQLNMTCYVDDITLSGINVNRSLLFKIHKIISKYGLKSHKMKLFSGRDSKVITGVCNSPGGERIPNKLHLKIDLGFKALKAQKTAAGVRKVARPLLGRLEAARQIDASFGARARTLRAQLRLGAFAPNINGEDSI